MPIKLLLSTDLYQGPPIGYITLDGVAQPSVPVTVLHGRHHHQPRHPGGDST